MKKTKKENFRVRNIHDRDGHTEQIIIEKSEAIKAVEKWLEDNDFREALREAGLFQSSQTYGIKNTVELDTRTGKISTSQVIPNQYNNSDSFFIILASLQELEFSEREMCEGADMEAIVDLQTIIQNTPDLIEDGEDIDEYLDVEKMPDGKYKISWWDDCNDNYIDAKTFIEKFMGEDYDEWVANYEDWLLEDIDFDWMEEIKEYYENLREKRD